MTDPGAIVTAFIREFDTEHPDPEKLANYFTLDAVYHNIPMRAVQGRDAVRQVLTGYTSRYQCKGWEVRNQAVDRNVVLNERIDRFGHGDKVIELRVMGVFEVRDGKIAAWRDYFDAAEWQSQQ
ncbi:MAG: nuclear transport factor 2 family protein [Dehalococcoidia bacterium]|nr:nuclear transport factor 2 family protein [Dehalococcoidia bacterium]